MLAGYRLAYIDEAPVNWCPGLGTVLSNEEVTPDGRSAIGNFPVFRRNLRQWMMRITAYADRLLDDLDRLDWPESVKSMQRNWIGRSYGARRHFPVLPNGTAPLGPGRRLIEVYTTRPDTLFGATYMVLAPEHPLVDAITAASWPEGTDPRWTGGAATPAEAVADYRRAAVAQVRPGSAGEQAEDRRLHRRVRGQPGQREPLPVFIADYVLMGYGTGAIMAVPGQDTRDWDFATAFGLPIIRTVQPPADHPDGPGIHRRRTGDQQRQRRDLLNGLGVAEAKTAMIDWLAGKGFGRAEKQYKLRDWLFSRQRYWGEPFPIVYDDDGVAIALPDDQLPLTLPEVTTTRRSPSTRRTPPPSRCRRWPGPPSGPTSRWIWVTARSRYRRELNVMPQWAGSCWYELRYLDPTNDKTFCDPVSSSTGWAQTTCPGSTRTRPLPRIREFLTGSREPEAPDRVLATVLFTDIVGSTERATMLGDRRWRDLLDAHHARRAGGAPAVPWPGGRHRGRRLPRRLRRPRAAPSAPGGRSSRRCACIGPRGPGGRPYRRGRDACRGTSRESPSMSGRGLPGPPVRARCSCRRTVRDLVSGWGSTFEDRGMHALKGVEEERRLYAVAG